MNAQEYYSIIEQLTDFQNRADEIKSIKDLASFIAKFKNFIFMHDLLRTKYENSINDFKKYQAENIKKTKLISKMIMKFINSFNSEDKQFSDSTLEISPSDRNDLPFTYYYPHLRYVMGEKRQETDSDTYIDTDITKIKIFNGIEDFYLCNIENFIISNIIKTSISEQNKMIKRIKDYVTKRIDEETRLNANFYALEYENYFSLNRNAFTSDKFYIFWINSAIFKIIETLQICTKENLHVAQNISKRIKRSNRRNGEQLTEEEEKIFKIVCETNKSPTEIATERHTSVKTVRKQIDIISAKKCVRGIKGLRMKYRNN